MDDNLPSQFDVIVIGTGLPESILAAACARSGLSVLHLDRNEYYGGNWSSFNLKSIQQWANDVDRINEQCGVTSIDKDVPISDDEEIYTVGGNDGGFIRNVHQMWHCCEVDKKTAEIVDDQMIQPRSEVYDDGQLSTLDVGDSASSSLTKEDANNTIIKSASDAIQSTKKWTRNEVESESRRFNLDIAPKILLSRGSMVKILAQTEVGKYAEFKCVDRLLCRLTNADGSGTIEQVPCSRSEVFSSDKMSMLDKRHLMKFLTFCLNWKTQMNSNDLDQQSFVEFVESKGLSDTLRIYIIDMIAILAPNATTIEGLNAIEKFLHSVGQYGNSPFLWTLYGSGELPQCFSRLCAVFGGIYCLRRSIDRIIVSKSTNRCIAIMTEGQRIGCEYLIISPEYCPSQLVSDDDNEPDLLRAILLSDRSILVDDTKSHVSLMNLTVMDKSIETRLIEIDSGVCVAPTGIYVSHLIGHGRQPSKEAFKSTIVSQLFSDQSDDNESNKPCLLYSLYFNIRQCKSNTSKLPVNMAITSMPDATIDYDTVIESYQFQTRTLFGRFWPDRDFLPHMVNINADGDNEEEVEAA